VFTANAGVVVKNTAVLSRFKYPQRRQEEPVYQSWFESKGYQVVQPRHYFEGAGDLLDDSQGRYWLGSGFRTDAAVKPELEMILQQEVNLLELVYPHWYHLDTCFCPLSNGELLWYPKAFSESSQRLIRNSFDRSVEVDDQDAESFACNAVCIGREIFMSLAPTTQEKLNILGYNTTAFELSEFQKSGGSAKCLTLRFD
jgi:N-dimethylarginine dimethylaminohydrolase